MGWLNKFWDDTKAGAKKIAARLPIGIKVNRLESETKRIERECNSVLDIIRIGSDLEEICQKMTDYMAKYGNDYVFSTHLDKFRKAKAAAEEHNREVDRIFCEIEKFDYQQYIQDPISNNKYTLLRFQNLANEVSEYWHLSDTAQTFLTQYRELEGNFDALVIQYKLKHELAALMDEITGTDVSVFLDSDSSNVILRKVAELRDSRESGAKTFYRLPTVETFQKAIDEHNERYTENAMRSPLFDDVNGESLSEEQRRAAVCEDKTNLVVAAAGSGKTLAVCGRIKYLLEMRHVKPSDILVLSYSKDTVKDLQDKISILSPDVTVKTFHALGFSILNDPREADDKYSVHAQFDAAIEKYFSTELEKDDESFTEVVKYFAFFSSSLENEEKRFQEIGDLYAAFKENKQQKKYRTIKDALASISGTRRKIKTIEGEYVKSYEELVIANFLYLNGVNYEYEKPYKHATKTATRKQYTPDFYLPDYDIYWEHYGFSKDGRVPQFEDKAAQEYIQGYRWKQQLHQQYQTRCLETYSWQFSEGVIFKQINEMLDRYGIKRNPRSPRELHAKLETIIDGNHLKHFKNLVSTFLKLYKAKYRDESMFDEFQSHSFSNDYEQRRARIFLSICKKIFIYYRNQLSYSTEENPQGHPMIDFDDMILKSSEELTPSNPKFKYKYIIVDEFQDISFSRMNFLQALIAHGGAKLFAVGDDWQSIYRFSGSDIDIFVNFQKYFGEGTINKLTQTYRNSNELLEIASTFIMANDRQIKKNVHSDKSCNLPVQVRYYTSDETKATELEWVLERIHSQKEDATVFLLGRNNYDVDKVLTHRCKWLDKKEQTIVCENLETLKISFKTAHGSKGLQADYVIIINAENARTGFPNKMEDDKLLELVLANADAFPHAEERRLFYVALTRTKNICYILANRNRPSIFLSEILGKCIITNPPEDLPKRLCPSCKSGVLQLRSTGKTPRYSCSNYPWCDYVNFRPEDVERGLQCPHCGDYLTEIPKYDFYGCPNFRKKTCQGHTIPIDKTNNFHQSM